MRKALTLLELLVVMVIVGILAVVAVPQYLGSQSAALHGKAQHAVGILAEAEKIVQVEFGAYVNFVAGGANAAVGTGVDGSGIDLTTVDVDPDWDYSVAGNTITATGVNARVAGCTFTYNLDASTLTGLVCP